MATFEGKVAVITGAGSGIGRATATVLAERGASVVIADINEEAAQSVAKELSGNGLSALAVTTDIGSEEQIHRMIETTVYEFGGVDILHNNAALSSRAIVDRDTSIVDVDAELFELVLRVNLIGQMLGAKHAIPYMIERGGGVIINTASLSGLQAELVRPMYGTSKAAVIGMVRNIATQYGKQGIRAIGIAPGPIVTPGSTSNVSEEVLSTMLRHAPATRLGVPNDIAYLVAFLASDEAGFITGVTIPVDGGLSAHFATYADDMTAAI